jgi:hypothetical protein
VGSSPLTPFGARARFDLLVQRGAYGKTIDIKEQCTCWTVLAQ